MRKNYFTTTWQQAFTAAGLICCANRFVSRFHLVFLMLCALYSAQAQCPSPPGDPSVFGNNRWNVYVYDNNDLSLATAIYSGYYTVTALSFDSQDSWNQDSSPSNTEGWTGCPVNSDAFTFVYKRKGFPCGNYTSEMVRWDDAAAVYLDGALLWSCAAPSGGSGCAGTIGEITLNENSEIEIRVREDGGNAFAGFSLVNTTASIAGSLSASGTTTICANTFPNPITLSGYSGSIVKWQSAADAEFIADVADIATTSAVLSASDMGTIAQTRYYRAVVQNGTCYPEYTEPVQITVHEPIVYSGGAWSGLLTETKPIIVEDDLVMVDDVTVCSCEVRNGKTLTVNPGVTLTVATSVVVETGAQLVIKDSGSLIQASETAVNTGNVEVRRNTQPMKTYDYTYWSSPVQGNTLFDLSPLTTSDKYYRFNPVANNWVSIANGAQVMVPGSGYIVRAPQGWAVTNATSGVYSGAFKGVPNNGTIPVTIQKGAGTFNLIGNPYPSAINIDSFLTDPGNMGIVNGTIYLWSHNTAISASIPGNAVYNYTADDYAKYNLTGGIRTASAPITGGNVPSGMIASGQGFFIEAATGLSNGDYTVNFKNSMRVESSNSDFYRTAQPANTATQLLEKNRLWINISNAQGAYNQALVGYITNATNGADALFDGKPWAAGNVVSLYSVEGANTYSIQGRALPFTNSDVVPLGYSTTIAGNFTIALESFDGLFQNQGVYLLDKTNSVTQDLKAGSYTFASAVGTFNDRFEIRYTGTTLSVGNPPVATTGLAVYSDSHQLALKGSSEMATMAVYDLAGRELYHSGSIHSSSFKTPSLNLQNQVILVKAVFENGAVLHKKAILN